MIALVQNGTQPLEKRYLGHLIAYLKLKGWHINNETSKWYEFRGEQDIHGHPLEIILPRESETTDASNYIEKAINLLSEISEETVNITAQRVQYYFSDVFIVSNTETGIYQSISLGLATTQINKIKSLILYGARTERHPQPYFHKPSSVGKNLLTLFRFGHTVHGSFGLTVEAPILHDAELFTQSDSNQPPLLPNLGDFIVETQIHIPPIERRIIERIVRGLVVVKTATNEHSIDLIVQEYGSGFSGNMCDAVVSIGGDDNPIEYRILWSPKIPVSDDLAGVQNIRLNETSYTLLKEAVQELKHIEPEYELVRGIITHVGSTVAPLSETSDGRSVIIRRIFDDERRSHNIIAPLDKDQYIEAYRAHLEWSTVEMTGIVERVGATYRLLDVKDFRITNSPR